MRGELCLGDGIGRRLPPLGGEVMAADRLLNVGLEDGDKLSEPEVTKRCEQTGMRDLEFGLPGGDPWPGLVCRKGAGTAISGFHGSARGSLVLSKSLRTRRCLPVLFIPAWTASKEVVCPRYHAVGVSGDFAGY